MVARVPLAALKVGPAESPSMYAGIVGWFGAPLVPMALGPPATLLTTRVATAPAFCVLVILTEKSQLPREMTAIAPVSEPAGSALQARSRPAAPLPATAFSGAVR